MPLPESTASGVGRALLEAREYATSAMFSARELLGLAGGLGRGGLLCSGRAQTLEELHLLKIAIGVLLLLWVLGIVTHHTMGGFVHVLLVLALVLFLIRLVRGPTP
jgi:hypothetical protein